MSRTAPALPSSCLSEEELQSLLDGRLSHEEERRMDAHIDQCADCHELVAMLVRARTGTAAERLGPPAAPPLQRGFPVGRYLVLDEIGRGGMGVVYSAYDPDLGRKVALKLLRSELLDEQGSERLRREAQALARLSHPNVVGLYDVGTYGAQPFIVMELLQGETLGEWLAKTPSVRARLSLLIQAGRGLQAAHEAGLVHRDFKPSNVLIDRSGRARVLDFGLARPVQEGAGVGPTPGLPASLLLEAEGPRPPGRMETFTRTGTVLGTPAYMAPEQQRGEPSDTRCDQWSFCIVLYEALYGRHPFAADSLAEVLAAMRDGSPHPPPREARVPRRVEQAVLRGLRSDPQARHPSMAALLAELQTEQRTARRIVAAGLALVLPVGGGLAYAISARGEASCRSAAPRLAGVWDGARRSEVRASLLATGKPYAAATFDKVAATLDSYVGRLVSLSIESCQATRLRGEQSEALYALRRSCLETRIKETSELTSILAKADGAVVERAAQAAQELSPLDECSDPRRLLSRQPLHDPAQRAEAERLSRELAAVKALSKSSRYAAGLSRIEAALPALEKLGAAHLSVEALLLQARLQRGLGRFAPALTTGRKALWSAIAAGEDEVAFSATGELMRTDNDKRRFAEADLHMGHAEALLHRLGSRDALAAEFFRRSGFLHLECGRAKEAQQAFTRALDLAERSLPANDPTRSEALTGLALVAQARGELRKALTLFKQALVLDQARLGPEHPGVATLENSIGGVLLQLEDDEALPHLLRCLEIRRRTLPPDHPDLFDVIGLLATYYSGKGQHELALTYHKDSLDIVEKTRGRAHPNYWSVHLNLGTEYAESGQIKRAHEHLLETLQGVRQHLGAEHPLVAQALSNLGEIALRRGAVAQAIQMERSAVTALEKMDQNKDWLLGALETLGEAYQRAGKTKQAALVLKRAGDLRAALGKIQSAE